MVVVFTLFIASLIGIILLFVLKYWEIRSERVIGKDMRERADQQAERFKALVVAARSDLANVPPEILRATRSVVHEAALALAALLGFAQRQAHRLADFVSHKRGFEKRETRSEFLKKVSEHKNANGLDAGASNGQNT